MRGVLSTAEGQTSASFGRRDWLMIGLIALIWGSSYLWIDIAVDHFDPFVVACGRVAFGFVVLSMFPAARRPIDRTDQPRLAVLSVVWLAIPLSLYPIAEQWITSSVAGMMNGALPILVALVAAVMLGRPPGRNQQIGMVFGGIGVVLIALPTWRGGSRLSLGVMLVSAALVCYAVAANISVPLTQKYGGLVVQRAMQLRALLLTAPLGLFGLRSSEFSWRSLGALAVLGIVGTGAAFAIAAQTFARVGATRGASFNYLIPVVAIVLGVVVRGDEIAPLALLGTAGVLLGAYFCSRPGR